MILEPMLLNGGDTLQISLLLAGHDGIIETDARIEGVNEIKNVINSPLKPFVKVAIVLSFMIITGVTLLYIFVEEYKTLILLMVMSIIAALANVLADYLAKKKREKE